MKREDPGNKVDLKTCFFDKPSQLISTRALFFTNHTRCAIVILVSFDKKLYSGDTAGGDPLMD